MTKQPMIITVLNGQVFNKQQYQQNKNILLYLV